MQRAAKELAQKEFALPGDSTGGISKLYAASIKHNTVDDNEAINGLLEKYSSAGKGFDGLPSQERVLTRWSMQLATEDLIRDWVQISEPALEKFMNDNFS
jgi:hypothetical protein